MLITDYTRLGTYMKQIEIIVPHERLSEVNDILYKHSVGGMMFYDIKGRGRALQREAPLITAYAYNYGKKYVPEFGSRTKVDVMVSDPLSKQIVDELVKNLSTGSASDGKIFVKDVSEAYDIGSKQNGEMALQ
jgi:nitrogen regulatory protein P-II 1